MGIYLRDSEDQAAEHARKFGLTFPSGVDINGNIASTYEITGVPTHIFVDRKGEVSYSHVGGISEKELARRIEEILE